MPSSTRERRRPISCRRRLAAVLPAFLISLVLPLSAHSEPAPERSPQRGERSGENFPAVRGNVCDPDPLLPELVYQFAGAINNTTSTVTRATVVQCTNTGDTSTQLQVILYEYNATSAYCGSVNIDPLDTATFESSPVDFYSADVLMGAGSVEQGLGQIRAEISDIICTVQVVDPDNTPPGWGFDIPLHRVASP